MYQTFIKRKRVFFENVGYSDGLVTQCEGYKPLKFLMNGGCTHIDEGKNLSPSRRLDILIG